MGTALVDYTFWMQFRRLLAVILLLILPLQSTWAAIDSCCNSTADQQVLVNAAVDHAGEEANTLQVSDDPGCCTLCDFCNHASAGFNAPQKNLHATVLTAAPVPRPDIPIDSFIPEVPSRPDRA